MLKGLQKKAATYSMTVPECKRSAVRRATGINHAKGVPMLGLVQKKSTYRKTVSAFKKRRRPTLPLGVAVPSAQTGLTSLFGMVRGGPRRHGHLKLSVFFHSPWAMVCPNCIAGRAT